MKKLLFIFLLGAANYQAAAQITITAADMPVAGDTLRYSAADVTVATFNVNDTGANKSWDFRSLVSTGQQVDTYKTALQVNPIYALTAPLGCYGYKVADSFPGASRLGITVTSIYTFFNKISSNSSYSAVAYGATVSGIPVAAKYSINDEWYFFPLSYGRRDSSNFAFAESLPGLGSLNEGGNRVTKADAWGTIRTPFYTSGVNCVRIRSEVNQIDTIVINAFNINIPFPSNTVDYKFLVNGQHYPALWVTTTKAGGMETVTSMTYRDSVRNFVSVPQVKAAPQNLTTYPNPAVAGATKINVPASWGNYAINVYDLQGRQVASISNTNTIDLSGQPAGNYVARIVALNHVGYAVITR